MSGNTLILWFHPEHDKSHTGRAMAEAAGAIEGVTVVDMYGLYSAESDLDVEAEVARLYTADRLIFQYPIHWYLPPPLLAAWQNAVVTRMFYVHPKEEGARLAGLPVMVAATAGNVPEAYTPQGANLYPLEDLIRPLHSTVHRCGMRWADPFLVFRANRIDEAERAQVAADYAARIRGWTDSIARS